MRSIKTTTGIEIPIDGELLTVHETLYREVTVKQELARSYDEMYRHINDLVDQMTDDERRAYLLESLSVGQIRYENDRTDAYLKKLGKKTG